MNEHKFHSGKVMKSTPIYVGTSLKTNRKHVLLREVAQLKFKQEQAHDLEYWLYMYSDHTIERLNNEMLKLSNGNPKL